MKINFNNNCNNNNFNNNNNNNCNNSLKFKLTYSSILYNNLFLRKYR